MLKIKSVFYKNFLATGSAGTKIDFDKHDLTLIRGNSGAGKTTSLDAILFALFGKTAKAINKPNVVNSINGKDCLVELDFSYSGKEYKIIRGVKPNVFDIYENGNLINQSSVKDYQEYLEDHVIKTNFRTFTQTVILSSTNYIPFMRLPTYQRRDVIEEVLDIKVFSSMNTLLKDRVTTLRDDVKAADIKIKLNNEKVKVQNNFVQRLEKDSDDRIDAVRKKITEVESNIDKLHDEITELTNTLTNSDDISIVKKKLSEYSVLSARMDSALQKLQKEVEFYQENDHCPTCHQDISNDHKTNILDDISKKISASTDAKEKISAKYEEVESKLDNIQSIIDRLKYAESSLKQDRKTRESLKNELDEINSSKDSIDDERQKLKLMLNDIIQLNDDKIKMSEDLSYYEIIGNLLKDTGIKAKIIKQYIPIINKLINQYLDRLDFFVNFNLDEEFNETLKSRHRDAFKYDNFSEGERQKIDLSILFAFREIAKMKSSISCNLLFLDEILDSHLDQNGVDSLMSLLRDMKDTNIVVISHRSGETMMDKFDNVLTFSKVNNYSVLVDSDD